MRLYLDNNLVTHALRHIQGITTNMPHETLALVALSARTDVSMIVSDESLAEIRKLPENSLNRKALEPFFFKLRDNSLSIPIIRNSNVTWDDPIALWDSPNVYWDHPYDDSDLNKAKALLISKGNHDEFDARYIANTMLVTNNIYAFLTVDKRTIWNYREDIKNVLGVLVKLPSELLEELNALADD